MIREAFDTVSFSEFFVLGLQGVQGRADVLNGRRLWTVVSKGNM